MRGQMGATVDLGDQRPLAVSTACTGVPIGHAIHHGSYRRTGSRDRTRLGHVQCVGSVSPLRRASAGGLRGIRPGRGGVGRLRLLGQTARSPVVGTSRLPIWRTRQSPDGLGRGTQQRPGLHVGDGRYDVVPGSGVLRQAGLPANRAVRRLSRWGEPALLRKEAVVGFGGISRDNPTFAAPQRDRKPLTNAATIPNILSIHAHCSHGGFPCPSSPLNTWKRPPTTST